VSDSFYSRLRNPTSVQTGTSCSVAAGQFVKIDSTAGAYTATLVSAPADKTAAGVKLVASAATVNAVTVTCGGTDKFNLPGGSATVTLKLLNQGVQLQYNSSAGVWDVHGDDLPLGGLTAKPSATESTYFVSAASYASDSNDGLTVYTAKATIAGALTALGSSPGLIQVGAGAFTISAADGSGNGVTLGSSLQRIRGMGADITRISLSATMTWGIVLQGALSGLEDLTIQVASGGNVTYACGVTSATSAESCWFRRVYINGGAGGTLVNGFAVSPDHHADVAFTNFWDCKALACTGAGWIINDGTASNVLDTRMFGCVSENNQYGVKANSAGFRWYGGDFGENTFSDIYLASMNESDPVVIDGPRSENSARMLFATAVSTPATVSVHNYYFGVGNDSFLSSDGAFINYGFSGNLDLRNITYQNQGTVTPLILLGANTASSGFTLTVTASGLQVPQPLHQLFSSASTEAVSVVATSYTQLTGTGSSVTSGTYIPGPMRLGPGFKTFTWNGTGRDVMSPVEFQTLSSAGAVAIQGVAEYAKITLQANCTSSSVTNLYPGQCVTISWVQDATGGRTYAWPSNCVFANGTAPAASTAANAVDSVTFYYDGTSLIEVSSRPSSAVPSVQFVTATGSYTWTKPSGAQAVDVRILGGGGGGGSGCRGAASTVRCGGGGGAGGVLVARTFVASDLPSSVTGSVGAGGSGGAAVTTDTTNGNAGGNGTGATFGSFAFAPGGNGGAGGSAASGTGGVTSSNGGNGGAGGSASTTGAAANGSGSSYSASGGGAGGTVTSANVASAGGTASFSWNGASSNTGSGGVVDTTIPTAGTQPSSQGTPSCGGGAGAASVTTVAQTGASAFYGGGGGGGGASVNGSNSGAGGAGGAGWALIVTHFS
jgi:hypothetical protein